MSPSAIRSILRHAVALGALLCGLASPAAARAQALDGDWIEADYGRFVLIYPAQFAGQFEVYASAAGEAANDAYDQLARLYGEPVTLPINIRVYADRLQFAQLNPLVPPLAEGAFHTHLGAREIALIAPFPSNAFETLAVANVLRHELDGLFLSALSAGEMPPGLELGINQYVEFPGPQIEDARAKVAAAYDRGVLLSWTELFSTPAVYSDLLIAYPQSLSVAAFLVDSYGFAALIELAQSMAQRHGYRAAFAQAYDRPIDRLEADWLVYLPVYLESRWQRNALFSFDLAPFEAALRAGAYTQVARGMEVVIPFLEATGQAAALQKAQALHADAAKGLVAGELVAQAREALQAGDPRRALDLAGQAKTSLEALGNTSRLEEIDLYLIRANELLTLRSRLAEAQRLAGSGQTLAAEVELAAVGPRLSALGDAAGAQSAADALEGLRAQRASHAQWATFGALLVGAAVLGHRAFDYVRRRRRRIESSIL